MRVFNYEGRKVLVWLLFLFLLSRLAVLFTSIGEVFNSEDLAMGVAAKEVINGAVLPLFEYQYLTYSPGTPDYRAYGSAVLYLVWSELPGPEIGPLVFFLGYLSDTFSFRGQVF